MKKLDFFILKSFIGPFIMTFLIVIFVLIMQFLWLYIDDLVGKGLSLAIIFEFLGWGTATVLPLALPLATLLASIMTMGNMGEHNELLAMKAAGVSLQRVLVPLIYVSVIISIGAFFISNNLIPVAYNKIYTLQYDIGKTKEEIKIPRGIFYNGIDGYVLRINDRNDDTDMMYNVIVYNHTGNKGNVGVTIADSGSMKATEDKSSLIFTLYDGISYEEDNTRKYRDTTYKLNIVEFSRQDLIIPLENYTFQKSEEERYGSEIMAKNLEQLRTDRDSISNLYVTTIEKHRGRFSLISGLTYYHQLDSTKNSAITTAYPYDSLNIWQDDNAKLNAYNEAIAQMRTVVNTLDGYGRELEQYKYPLRRIDLESYRKFTLSFACLIFFFIGAPLGAIIRKGGLGTPAIISILFFVLYWVIDISGKKLARDGVITPALGAFISTIILLPIGIFLTLKSTKDSSLFNADSYIQFFKSIFKKTPASAKGKNNTDPRSLKIIYMGTPEFAVEPLRMLVGKGYNISAVVTVPDKPSGRGLKPGQSDVKKYALETGLPILQPASLKDPGFLDELASYQADMFIVVAFRMLPKSVWQMPRLGTFNLHASLLPEYRGAAPINWAIINGEKESGVTTFMIDEKIDTGAIILQEKCPIEEGETAGSLHDKLMYIGANLVIHTVDLLASGKAGLTKQEDITNPDKAVKKEAPKLTRELAHIDWSKDPGSIIRLIRGLSPHPGAYTYLVERENPENKIMIKIYNAELSDPDIVSVQPFVPVPGIIVTEIQMAGKKRMSAKAFLAGFRNIENYIFQ